jgi:hypothetical protein
VEEELICRYAPACIKLLAQYKSLMKLVGDDIGGVESFMKRFKVSFPVDMDREMNRTGLMIDGPPSRIASFNSGSPSNSRTFIRSHRRWFRDSKMGSRNYFCKLSLSIQSRKTDEHSHSLHLWML